MTELQSHFPICLSCWYWNVLTEKQYLLADTHADFDTIEAYLEYVDLHFPCIQNSELKK